MVQRLIPSWAMALPVLAAAVLAAPALAGPTALDRVLAQENSGKDAITAPVIDDLAFLRRVSIDLIGRIPTVDEIRQYEAWPKAERRQRVVEKLLSEERFNDRWTVFFADMLRIRSNATGGTNLLAYVYHAVKTSLPYDEMARQLIASNGKPSISPEVGFILGDNAEPMALAASTAQTFLGIRIACAECHDHPFDEWTQEQFYGLAAYFGKTRRVESRFSRSIYTTEGNESTVMWPPERQKPKERHVVDAAFPFKMEQGETNGPPPRHIARLMAARAAQAKARQQAEAQANATAVEADIDSLLDQADQRSVKATEKPTRPAAFGFDVVAEAKMAARNINVKKELYRSSVLRHDLAKLVTDPRNPYFSRAMVNRVWSQLMGRGFVEPVDDMGENNPASHPQAMTYLANEFVASGYDLRTLIGMIVTSEAYQRGHLAPDLAVKDRRKAEHAFTAAIPRRMLSEALYDSIVQAGHLKEAKWPQGANMRTIRERVRVAIGPIEGSDTPAPAPAAVAASNQMAMAAKSMPATGYDLEKAIEIDFAKAFMDDRGAPKVDMMQAMSKEEIEANRMLATAQQRVRMRYKTVYQERQIDDNPVYPTSATRMATPAPAPHFIRVFGQPARADLGDNKRAHDPTMRQALMMLNGRLTNEAARVGPYEPMQALLEGPKANRTEAVRYAYREILTREPSADEVLEGKAVLASADTPADGMADLRWVLFNCHEFRFLP